MWVLFLVGLGTASWETLAGFSGICRDPNNYMIWLVRLWMEDSTGTEDRGEAGTQTLEFSGSPVSLRPTRTLETLQGAAISGNSSQAC